MLTTLLTAVKLTLPGFTEGGKYGSWRMYALGLIFLVDSTTGQEALAGFGVPATAIMWMVMKTAAFSKLMLAVTLVKDKLKAAATVPVAT